MRRSSVKVAGAAITTAFITGYYYWHIYTYAGASSRVSEFARECSPYGSHHSTIVELFVSHILEICGAWVLKTCCEPSGRNDGTTYRYACPCQLDLL